MRFTPLSHYKRAMAVAVCLPILVAAILCLHLYQLKLERAYQTRLDGAFVINSQVDEFVSNSERILDSIELTVSQPLGVIVDNRKTAAISQYDDYFYQMLPHNAGELVGPGRFNAASSHLSYQQSLYTLAPVFANALMLSTSLEAIAYVNEAGTAFVKRRETGSSELLTAIINRELSPDFSSFALLGSKVHTVNNRQVFALGRQLSGGNSGYLLLIYDLDKLSLWLHRTSLLQGEVQLINQYNEVLASSNFVASPFPKEVKEARSSRWENGVYLERIKARPVNFIYYESANEFKANTFYELFLEFSFLSVFLLLTAIGWFWLSLRVFIKPVEHFVSYLVEQKIDGTANAYKIPRAWQPWFRRIKMVVEQKQSLLNKMSENNVELDQMLRAQTRALERSLEAKEKQTSLLNTMLDSIPDLIYFKNIDGSFLGCNWAFEQFIGVDRQHLVGRAHEELTDNYHELIALEKRLFTDSESQQQQCVFGVRVFEVRVSPFYHEHKMIGSMTILRDITQIDAMVKAIKQSESKFRAAIEFAANGMMLIAIDGTIMELNKAAKRFFSHLQPAVGSLLKDLLPHADYKNIEDSFAELLAHDKKVVHVTLEQLSQYSHLQLSASLVWDEHLQPLYFVLHIQNITALTNARLAAERATLAKSRFIANVSHEVRTPLNAIVGLSEQIAVHSSDLHAQDNAKKIDLAAQQLLSMMNSILDFAKVENQKGKLQHDSFLIMDVIDTCKTLTEIQCHRKGLIFNVEIDADVEPVLVGDVVRIKQVLLNLLSNAVKFTATGSVTLKVQVETQLKTSQVVRFSVIDTGIGIKPEIKTTLFDAFTQGDDSNARKYDGIGLGLAIVKHEVMLMGGEIDVTSEVQQGSHFFFSLKLDVASQNDEKQIPPFVVLGCDVPSYLSSYKLELTESPNENSETSLEVVCLLMPILPTIEIENRLQMMLLNGLRQIFTTPKTAQELRALGIKAHFVELPVDGFWQIAYMRMRQGVVSPSRLEPVLELNGALIMVIDDNALNLKIAENILKHVGASVCLCQYPERALDIVMNLKPDVILMDIHMPEVDGFTLTKQIRQHFSAELLPIIALTADTEILRNSFAQSAGMNDVITKPIDKATFTRVLSAYAHSDKCFYDKEFALSQMMGNHTMLVQMLRKFATLCNGQLEKLQSVTAAREIGLIAHSIKGTAGGLGFKRLVECAKVVESQGKSEQFEQAHVTALVQSLKQAKQFIELNFEEDDEQERTRISHR